MSGFFQGQCRITVATMLLGACLCLAGLPPVHAEEALIAPRAIESLLVDITRAGSQLVAVGERGHILVSADEGQSWRQVAVPVDVLLTAVHFATATEGWAVGHDGVILHTVDGGGHWSVQRNAAAGGRYAPPLLAAWFRDVHEGWAVGAFGLVLHTIDGGAHWEDLSARIDNPDGLHCNAVTGFGDGTVIIAGERGLLLLGQDHGASWQRVAFPYEGSLFGVLASGQQALAFGLRGHAFRSEDSGAHWQAVTLPSQQTLSGGMATADGRVVLVGQGGTVLSGRWDTAAFNILQQQQRYHLSAVVATGNALLAAGQGGIHRVPWPVPAGAGR